MGTVGLSFGSPTSGTGFDVSATVSQIVANLSNVETPWKTQLTALESQDTVISSLGTLFSNLSNDMSSLTDFQGILAQKTGSSSDTNVLELTGASSSATAGTHTVVVNSLAQTSSGYLAELASSSDVLTGSITLQVGSGTAMTIVIGAAPSSPAADTVYTGGGADTLADLAAAINSSGAGVAANVLTDSTGSRLSLTSGTSGAGGNITVTANTLSSAVSHTLGFTGTAGSSSANSTGTLAATASASEALAGSISIEVGDGATETIYLGTSDNAPSGDLATGTTDNTLSSLESYINDNYQTLGVKASIVTNTDGTSSLSLTSQTAGADGTLSVNSSLTDSSTALAYTASASGADANLTVDGIDNLTSASNTVTNLIPGLTFQLLSSSSTPVQVTIANDNSDIESTVNQFVTDYNSLISALNTQEGKTSSGTPEPLFGSPTLSLLQQQLLGGMDAESPNGYVDSISSSAGTTLSGSMTIQVGKGTAETFEIGTGDAQSGTVYTGSDGDTLADLAAAINSANLGVTAAVVTSNGESSLTLTSAKVGASGALTVTSALTASTPAALTYTDAGYADSSTPDSGTLGTLAGLGDSLSGSLTLQAGDGTAETFVIGAAPGSPAANTIYTGSGADTLSDLMTAINGETGTLGVTAALNSDGTGLILASTADGSAGALTVTSNLADTTSPTTTTLNYNASSDINTLTTLGISVNNDGSLTFDADSLDSVLNSDFSGVVGFFQNADSWGQNFSTMLTDAGTSSTTGILALASNSNSSIESTLNADISKEQLYISAQQSSLTAELNSANEILQELPSQLDGINELYSAITGYGQTSNG